MAIQALGFDLDGTLYPAWKMYGASAGLAFRYGTFLRAFAKARKILRDPGLMLRYENGAVENLAAFRDLQARIVAERLSSSIGDIKSLIDTIIYGKVEESFHSLQPYPDLIPCLEALRSAGFKLGLLSDLPPERKLSLMGLDRFFHRSLCYEDSGSLNPDRRPFLALAAALDLPPASILYVGNKEAYDIRGARSVGMKTALLGSGRGSEADFCFRRWKDFNNWFFEGAGRLI
ncbi:MAG: HAD family hydrolase [Spirochaetales bacterium]|nr:HAD family hydrolase [Spirochaetales bacterium]